MIACRRSESPGRLLHLRGKSRGIRYDGNTTAPRHGLAREELGDVEHGIAAGDHHGSGVADDLIQRGRAGRRQSFDRVVPGRLQRTRRKKHHDVLVQRQPAQNAENLRGLPIESRDRRQMRVFFILAPELHDVIAGDIGEGTSGDEVA